MITVEILSSNLDFFERYELEERLTYSDFHKISENMQEGEFIEFILNDENDTPFYKGKFEKKDQLNATEDILTVVKKYQSQKKISKKERKEIEKKINQSVLGTVERKNIPTKEKKKNNLPKVTIRSIVTNKAIPIKKIGVALLIIVLLFGGGITFAKAFHEKKPTQQTFEQLLEKNDYEGAVTAYPKKVDEVENTLFLLVQNEGRTHLDELVSFQKKYPTEQGAFDIALFNYDYEEGISVYESNESLFKKDETRQLLVGYAYLKENKLEKSEEIQKKLASPELEKFIRQYKQFTLVIEEKEKEIAELQKKPSENKEKIEKAIEALYEAKQSLAEL